MVHGAARVGMVEMANWKCEKHALPAAVDEPICSCLNLFTVMSRRRLTPQRALVYDDRLFNSCRPCDSKEDATWQVMR